MSDSDKPHVRTLSELAALAGVSAATASRAMADSSLIALATRERIQGLAREHGYHLNLTARQLRTGRTGAVAVLIPLRHAIGQAVSDPFFVVMMGHLADELAVRGYDLVLKRVVPEGQDWLSDVVDSGRVDGVILIGQSNQLESIDEVAARYKPLVVWGARRPGHCTVGSDNHEGGALAARHLLERGARRLAFLGDHNILEFAQRLEGVREVIGDTSIALVPSHISADGAHAAISAWLADPGADDIDGVVAATDVIAMSALRALSEHGRAVPRDVKVIGYNDIPLAQRATPPLSTIRQDIAQGAKCLVETLFRRMAGEAAGSVVLRPELVVRGSS